MLGGVRGGKGDGPRRRSLTPGVINVMWKYAWDEGQLREETLSKSRRDSLEQSVDLTIGPSKLKRGGHVRITHPDQILSQCYPRMR